MSIDAQDGLLVEFCEEPLVYLAVRRLTGVFYSPQVCGCACLHPEVEGAIVAAGVDHGGAVGRLMCAAGECPEQRHLDELVRLVRWSAFTEIHALVLDTAQENYEGWWNVTGVLGDPLYQTEGRTRRAPQRFSGVIFGPNCD